MGSVLSFAQLVIASVYIEHDAGGIIANPAKLGLSGLSFGFDVIFLLQKYYWFREKKVNRTVEEAEDR
jgi:cystinosin